MKEDAITWGGLGIDSFSMRQEVSRGHSTYRKRGGKTPQVSQVRKD